MSKLNKNIKGKFFKYFKAKLKMKPSTKGWNRSNCPFCMGNYCFGVNVRDNKFHCFKCEQKGSLIEALMTMENLSTINEARKYINLQQEYEEYEDSAVIARYEKKPVDLPESFRLIINAEGMLGKAAQNYVKKRGFKVRDLAMKGIGYCLAGKYAGYIIFPFYRKTKLVFFQGRKFMGFGPKMQNPGNEDFGTGKTELMYNQDALYLYNRINIVESITNAITLGDNTVAILGKSISDYQLKLLIKSPCEYITILLDDDALDKACILAMQLCNYKRVRLIPMPKGKDVNDLGKKATLKLMKEHKVEKYNYFFKLRQNAGSVNTH